MIRYRTQPSKEATAHSGVLSDRAHLQVDDTLAHVYRVGGGAGGNQCHTCDGAAARVGVRHLERSACGSTTPTREVRRCKVPNMDARDPSDAQQHGHDKGKPVGRHTGDRGTHVPLVMASGAAMMMGRTTPVPISTGTANSSRISSGALGLSDIPVACVRAWLCTARVQPQSRASCQVRESDEQR